eukprot:6204231-Pyramimonas_sp.AAC.1
MQRRASEDATGPQTCEIRLACPIANSPALLSGLMQYGRNRIVDNGLTSCATVTVWAMPCSEDGHVPEPT